MLDMVKSRDKETVMPVVDIVIDIPQFNTTRPGEDQLAEWEATLWDKGYLIIPNALPPAAVAHSS